MTENLHTNTFITLELIARSPKNDSYSTNLKRDQTSYNPHNLIQLSLLILHTRMLLKIIIDLQVHLIALLQGSAVRERASRLPDDMRDVHVSCTRSHHLTLCHTRVAVCFLGRG
jgi:hypothetical protein